MRRLFLFFMILGISLSPFAAASAAAVSTITSTTTSKTATTATVVTKTVTKTATSVSSTVAAKKPASVTPPPYERIFYYTGGAAAKADFLAHGSQIDVFAPQTYSIGGSGALTGSIDPTLLNYAEVNHIKVMPLVTNSAFSTSTIAAFLENPTTQESAIDEMVAEAELYGYSGWQLDFEQIDASYRDAYSAFVKQFGMAMKAAGLISSVAVIAQTGDAPSTYPKNIWQSIVGVYDYAALGQDVDFLSVMAYDDPYSKGPIAEYDWYKEVIAYSVSAVPASKISIGLGLYYWLWNKNTGKLVEIGGNSGVQGAFAKHYLGQSYSTLEQEPYLTYKSYGVNYVLWFENWESVEKKVALIKAYGLRGFSAWSLGLEVPSVWSVIRVGNKVG